MKLKKGPADNVSVIRQNNINREDDGQMKGKSVGSKKVPVMKESKYGPLTDKKGRAGLKSRVEAPKIPYADADMD